MDKDEYMASIKQRIRKKALDIRNTWKEVSEQIPAGISEEEAFREWMVMELANLHIKIENLEIGLAASRLSPN